jgi:hypothetical protein
MNRILLFLKTNWKYLVVFVLGILMTLLFLKSSLGTSVQHSKVQELEKKAEYWKGAYDQKEKERVKHTEIINSLDIIIKELKSEEESKEKEIQLIDNSKYKERDRISKYSEKELYEFYKKLNK